MATVDEMIKQTQKTGDKKRLLLHACCGPCLAGVLPQIHEFFDITIFFYNPNILPKIEFIKRLDTLKLLLSHFENVKLIVPDQDESKFLKCAEGLESLKEGDIRCTKCFDLRLRETAKYFALNCESYDAFTTTLTVSPRKNARLINEVGSLAAKEYGAVYLASDFKKKDGWLTSVKLSKELGLYRQNYCGCGFPAVKD